MNETIEIKTAHNILISYNLASPFDRVLAFIIDIIVLVFVAIILNLVAIASPLFAYILIIPCFLAYHLMFEIYNNGQSIGKKIMKLRVVKIAGASPSVEDFFMRWVFRTIDISSSLGMLAFVLVSSSAKGQRVGDLIANTTVINLNKSSYFDLKSIEMISDFDRPIRYPNIIQLSEEEMLLIKQSLSRYKAQPNPVNKSILDDIVTKVKEKINIKTSVDKNDQFLLDALKDYIVLTR